MYRITLRRPETDGYYRRNLGRLPNGKQPKFSVGTRKSEATRRLQQIAAIWQRIESRAKRDGKPAVWDDLSLAIAKAIAKGKPAYRLDAPPEASPVEYAHAVDTVADLFPEIPVCPADEPMYREGKSRLTELSNGIAAIVAANADRYRRILTDTDTPSGTRLHAALDAYAEHVAKECHDPSEGEGAISDTGKTRLNFVKQLKAYLPNEPLAALNDFASVDALFATLRARPKTKRYGNPMARKSAGHLLRELRRVFNWLHLQPAFAWRKPTDFASIKTTPRNFERDVEHETKPVPTWSVEQLHLLWQTATPLERLLLALGLNAAYGADQIGRLQISELVERDGRAYIHRIRRKQRVEGRHLLWAPTREAIAKAIGRRKTGHVLINSKGSPLWRKTNGGNRANDIPNAWYRLLARARKQQHDLPNWGFNSLRDTSASLIREIAGAEIASVHLSHKHSSPDKHLRAYANVPWEQVFAAQEQLGEQLAAVFVGEPLAERKKTPPKRSRKPAKTPQTAP